MESNFSLYVLVVLAVASIVGSQAVHLQIGDPGIPFVPDHRFSRGFEEAAVGLQPVPESEIPYTVSDGGLRESRARSRVRSDDPFGGCRLRCPQGFNRQDFHIHMHRLNRPINKGGVEPNHGLYHHDWRSRAE